MNSTKITQPDETTLTLWIDGELEGDALQRVEAWALENPEMIAQRDSIQAMSGNIKQHMPSSIEPPYPDFFNQHILRHIGDEIPAGERSQKKSGFWRWFAMPVAACAMAVCFYMGTQVVEVSDSAPPLTVAQVSPVYTPDGAVSANVFRSENATVIVLEGLADIPDDLEMVGASSERGPRLKSGSGAVFVNTEMTF